MSAPYPTHFIVLDYEGSGFSTLEAHDHDDLFRRDADGRAHSPGRDADCLLEVGFVVLDAKTLEVVDEGWSAIVPPGIATVEQFDEWCARLKEHNAFVFDMHTKNGLLDFIRLHLAFSRGKPPETLCTLDKVERDLTLRFTKLVVDVQPSSDGRTALNPGNSPLVFAGNSIANYDVPMMKLWMPKLYNMLSYRIQDVSVMRMFYNDIARIVLPDGLNEYIKSGGGKDVVHRALDDAKHCAHALKRLVGYAREVAASAAEYERHGGA